MAAVVTIPVLTPGSSSPALGLTAVVDHRTGSTLPGVTGDGELLGTEELHPDDDGEIVLNLEPCVGPLAGTVYVVSVGSRTIKLQPITDGEWTLGTEASLEIIAPGGAPGVSWKEGPEGVPGPPLAIVGEVPTVDDLPDTPEDGESWIVTADGWLRSWSATAGEWVVIDHRGPAGPQGEPGDLTVASDLTLPVPVISGGTATGGSIRRAQSLLVPWHYTQTVDAADPALGTAVNAQWNALVAAHGGGMTAGSVQTTSFGPRGTFNTEGILRYGVDMGVFATAPIPYTDLIFVGNRSGSDVKLNHAWSIATAPTIFAQDGRVTLGINDTTWGDAALGDTPGFMTFDGGEIDGLTNSVGHSAVLSRLYVQGKVSLHHRFGLEVHDVNGPQPVYPEGLPEMGGTDVLNLTGIPGPSTLGTFDHRDEASIAEQVGVWVAHLSFGDRNAGVLNGSTLVNLPQPSELTAAADTIRSDASTVHVAADSALTMTSTPTIAAGQWEGQELTLVNVGEHPVLLRSHAVLSGSGLALTSRRRSFVPGQALRLHWTGERWAEASDVASWFRTEDARSTPTSPSDGVSVTRGWAGGAMSLDMVAGAASAAQIRLFLSGERVARTTLGSTGLGFTDGVDGIDGSCFSRTGAGVVRLAGPSGSLHTLRAHQQGARQWDAVTVQTATSYSVPTAAYGSLITRDNVDASTQTWQQDSAATFPVGTEVATINLGAGTVTHSAGSGASLTTGSAVLQPQGKRILATKVAANTWHLAVSA